MQALKQMKGHFFAIFTSFVWATTFISTKILLQDHAFAPAELLWIRFLLGYLALWVLYPKRVRVQSKRHELYFALSGLCGVSIYFWAENIALSYSPASVIGVVVSVAPMFTGILAHFFLKENLLHWRFVVGFVLALLGIGLIGWSSTTELQVHPTGVLLALLAAFSWSVYSILGRKIGEVHYPTLFSTRRTFAYGLAFMLPVLFFTPVSFDLSRFLQPVYLGNLLFLSLVASVLCFFTWNRAVQLIGPTKTSIYIYLQPVISVLCAMWVLGEQSTLWTAMGICLTMVGTALSQWSKDS